MMFVSRTDRARARGAWGRKWFLAVLAYWALPLAGFALPSRLVIALDGVAYRDMAALQQGITRTNFVGQQRRFRAFTAEEGYYPVSRMISTFPSASDVAWTDIFGDRPLPGYQRTYYSAAANSLIQLNGVTTTMEHERQMDWQVQDGFMRAMGYMYPVHVYRYEAGGMVKHFWDSSGTGSFYAYIRATDDAQHLDRDIISLLCDLDRRLQAMRAQYRARTGHDLEIVILSDHGHNHAGRGIRVPDRAFLEKAGYHVGTAIRNPKDVVLPIVGVESWVEVHCAPAETERLASRLCGLDGTEILAATVNGETNRFVVMNARRERAEIDWAPSRNAFRYRPVTGDPLHYGPVLAGLASRHELTADGFAPAGDWMAATMANHYPLAPERIVRGLTRGALNPATILISLDNRYVNASWWVQQGSRLVTCRSTHGGLDDICSDGILLSNFQPTRDTSTARVAGQFSDFPGVRDFRAEEAGAELITKQEQALTRIARVPFDRSFQQLPDDGVYLRIWSPNLAGQSPLTVAIGKVPQYSTSPAPRQFHLDRPLRLPGDGTHERVYAWPGDVKLEPLSEYAMSGWLSDQPGGGRLFTLLFHTGQTGQPIAF